MYLTLTSGLVSDASAEALKKVKLLGSYASYRSHLDPLNRPGGERLSLPEAENFIGKQVRLELGATESCRLGTLTY